MIERQVEIVGAYHRPPAQWVLQALPSGIPLTLIPEPDNPHDENAIRVCADLALIPPSEHQGLAQIADQCGVDFQTLILDPAYQVGWVPRLEAVTIAPALRLSPSYICTLTFNIAGKPCAMIQIPR